VKKKGKGGSVWLRRSTAPGEEKHSCTLVGHARIMLKTGKIRTETALKSRATPNVCKWRRGEKRVDYECSNLGLLRITSALGGGGGGGGGGRGGGCVGGGGKEKKLDSTGGKNLSKKKIQEDLPSGKVSKTMSTLKRSPNNE